MSNLPPWDALGTDPAVLSLQSFQERVLKLAEDAKIDLKLHPVLLDGDWCQRILNRVRSSFTIAVIGQVSTGKSSLINALLGRRLLAPASEPTDGVVSVLMPVEAGTPEHAEKLLKNGAIEPFASVADALRFIRQQETPAKSHLACREVRLYLDEPWLKHLRVVNTPGLGDRLQQFEQATLEYLAQDESDLIIWTFFPDTAANQEELGIFSSALQRRKGTVIGVLARTLEGRTDPAYDPRDDVELKQVVGNIMEHLSDYIDEVVLFDSHEARRLVEKAKLQPDLLQDKAFSFQLERCGYARVREIVEHQLGPDGADIASARVRSLLLRCAATSRALATGAGAALPAFEKRAAVHKKEADAWATFERDVVEPARARMKSEFKTFAAERSAILVGILGPAAASAVREHFGLLGTLGRTLVSWTGACDSASDALNKRIEEAVHAAVRRELFQEDLERAARQLLREQLERLALQVSSSDWARSLSDVSLPVTPSGRAPAVDGTFVQAITAALKPVIAAALKEIAAMAEAKLAQKAAEKAAEKAAMAAAVQGVERAASNAAGQAAKSGVASTSAKVLGVATLVLLPFDISKLHSDFDKGREGLAKVVDSQYKAGKAQYEQRIFDLWWKAAYDLVGLVLADARQTQGGNEQRSSDARRLAEEARALQGQCTELAEEFEARARD